MAINNNTFAAWCDKGMVLGLGAAVFFLPMSIALLDSFAGVAVFFYLAKKISAIASQRLYQNPWQAIRAFAPARNDLNRPLQLLALAFLVSVVLSQYPSISAAAFFGKFIKCVFLYFCCIEALSRKGALRIFLALFMVSAVLTCVSGIVQQETGRDFLRGRMVGMENGRSSHRISSAFYGANGFGAYLLPVIALISHTFFLMLRRKSWGWAGLAGLVLALTLTCLCWTYSRSSWMGYLVFIAVMGILDRRKWWLAAALFMVFAFIFVPSLNQVRNTHLISDNSTGAKIEDQGLLANMKPSSDVGAGRSAYWKRAVGLVRLSPVWGNGFNTYAKMIHRNPDQRTWYYAHNCYLQMAAETGILGLGCFLWLVLVLFKAGITHCKHVSDPWVLSVLQAGVSGMLGFLVQSFFDNTFYTVQLGVLMWLMFGLIMAVLRLDYGRG